MGEKTRRGNGEASYRERTIGGTKYIEGRIRINGQQFSEYAKTKTACRAKIDKLRFNGPTKKPNKITVEDQINDWLAESIKPNLKTTTYENYKFITDCYIIPDLGKDLVIDLTKLKLQKMINKRAKTLAPNTVRRIRLIITAFLSYAEENGVITINPALKITSPAITKKKPKTVPKEDVQKLINVDTAKDQLASLAKLIVLSGLRRGEALGLKWSDIDFENKTIHIQRQIVRSDGKATESSLKTDESNQSVFP